MSLAETINNGLNNPECAFFVGQYLGQASTGKLVLYMSIIYFGIKLIDKIIFEGLPSICKKWRASLKQH